jgi:hypothetical protein
MDIPKNLWNKWTMLYSRGDADKIAELADVHPNTVLNAIRNGRCRTDLMEVIGKFFQAKEKTLNEIS